MKANLYAWYVQMMPGGHQVSHIHPTGWLSGVSQPTWYEQFDLISHPRQFIGIQEILYDHVAMLAIVLYLFVIDSFCHYLYRACAFPTGCQNVFESLLRVQPDRESKKPQISLW